MKAAALDGGHGLALAIEMLATDKYHRYANATTGGVMKKLSAAAIVASLLLSCPAMAADYPASAQWTFTGWNLSWDKNIKHCTDEVGYQLEYTFFAFIFTDDTGSMAERAMWDYNPAIIFMKPSLDLADKPIKEISFFRERPGQQHVEKVDYLTCGGDRLLMPGVAPAPVPVPVPTLSEWALILLGVLLAGGAALTIQRRRAA